MRRYLLLAAGLVCVALACLVATRRPVRDPDAVPARPAVVIQTANPYSFDVRLEVKCDWQWRSRQYSFYRVIVVPGKQQTTINVPSDLRFCEIWPKVLW